MAPKQPSIQAIRQHAPEMYEALRIIHLRLHDPQPDTEMLRKLAESTIRPIQEF